MRSVSIQTTEELVRARTGGSWTQDFSEPFLLQPTFVPKTVGILGRRCIEKSPHTSERLLFVREDCQETVAPPKINRRLFSIRISLELRRVELEIAGILSEVRDL
jgi:hypothetical protein